MLEAFSALIIHLIQTTGYFGVIILMFFESALIPIPSEVTMPFAGFLAQKGYLNLYLVILVGTLANLGGSLLAYSIGYYLEEHVILRLIEKYGKYILITTHEYDRSVKWFRKYGESVTFFSRILPAVRTFISLPAGLAKMNIYRFAIFTTLGSLIWSTVLALFGVYLGGNWNLIEPYFRKFQILIVIAFVFLILFYVNHKLKIIKIKK